MDRAVILSSQRPGSSVNSPFRRNSSDGSRWDLSVGRDGTAMRVNESHRDRLRVVV